MTSHEAQLLRQRIAELEREMMDFRLSMARVLAGLYETVHELESRQKWSFEPVEHMRHLRDCIVAHFNLGELRTMAFDLGIEFDEVAGETLHDKAREMVLLLHRAGRVDELRSYCRDKRPFVEI
jgi:hypothetical protein